MSGVKPDGGSTETWCVAMINEDAEAIAAGLVEVVRRSDAILIAIRAAAPELVELILKPAINATARFGIVTLAGRAEAPTLPIVRKLMEQLMHD